MRPWCVVVDAETAGPMQRVCAELAERGGEVPRVVYADEDADGGHAAKAWAPLEEKAGARRFFTTEELLSAAAGAGAAGELTVRRGPDALATLVCTRAPEFGGQHRCFRPRKKHELVLSIERGCADTVLFPTRTTHPVLTPSSGAQVCTSGSSGVPKAVMLSDAVWSRRVYQPRPGAGAFAAESGSGEKLWVSFQPPFHTVSPPL